MKNRCYRLIPFVALMVLQSPHVLYAQTPPSPRLDGPEVTLTLDTSSVEDLLKKIGDTKLTADDQSFIDSILKNPDDKIALEKAQHEIAKRLQWAMHELAQLKQAVLRYMVVSEKVTDARYLKMIAKTHSESAQNHYNRALWSIAGAYQDLSGILDECGTEICATMAAEAFEEMIEFVESVNDDLDFENAKSSVELFWKFQNPLLKASLDKTFRAMVPNNEDHNLWKVVGASVLAPLSFAGQAVYEGGKAVGTAIMNPRYLKVQLTVDEVDIDYDELHENIESQVKRELPKIVAGRETTSGRAAREAQERAARESVITDVQVGITAYDKRSVNEDNQPSIEFSQKLTQACKGKNYCEVNLVDVSDIRYADSYGNKDIRHAYGSYLCYNPVRKASRRYYIAFRHAESALNGEFYVSSDTILGLKCYEY